MLSYMNAKVKILDYIKGNALKAGDRLPTEAKLAEQLQIGRLSLREGLNALKNEGIILSIQGKGTFMACNLEHITNTLNMNYSVSDMIRSSGYEPECSLFKKEIISATKEIADSLRIEPNTDVSLCTRIRTADGVPVVLMKDYMGPSLASDFFSFTSDTVSLYNHIENRSGSKIGTCISEIAPICADKELAEALQVPEGTPLLEFRNICNDLYGIPIMYSQEFFRGDKFQFILTRGRS